MSILFKLIKRFNAVPIKISARFLCVSVKNDKVDLKIYLEIQRTNDREGNLETEQKLEDFH